MGSCPSGAKELGEFAVYSAVVVVHEKRILCQTGIEVFQRKVLETAVPKEVCGVLTSAGICGNITLEHTDSLTGVEENTLQRMG